MSPRREKPHSEKPRILRSPAATRKLGRALGELLEPYDFIALRGPLGAGKTLFVRGCTEGAGVPESEAMSSPTFALAHTYSGGRVPLLHFDLYRVESAAELFAIGFDDMLAEPTATLCEWPERAGSALPPERLEIALGHAGPKARTISINAFGPRAETLRTRLLAAL
jgi:tRNA threonylcarbamoyladenosine biosynthesis protein TsaE